MRGLLTALIVAALVPAAAAAAPTATEVRIGDLPAKVRVVVEFSGGSLKLGEVLARDPVVADGSGRVVVPGALVAAGLGPLRRAGVRVEVTRSGGRAVIRLSGRRRRFKYLGYFVSRSPERLVIELWKARPPSRAATIRSDGCLRLDRFAVGPNVASARGRALRPLFENSLVVRLRAAGGSPLATRPLTAARRRWRTRIGYSVRRRQRGTLEAFVLSAKDGALECLVQAPVTLGS